MKYSCLLLLAITGPLFFYGQDTARLRRLPYKLTLAVDKNAVYEEDLKSAPYVLPDNTVQLYPGETVYLEIEQENGIVKSVSAVRENINPAKTLVIAFTQHVKKNVHESMTLHITNPFPQKLIYKAVIFLLKKNWVDTNVYPVEAGLSSFEIWPDVITSIGLGHWAFQQK